MWSSTRRCTEPYSEELPPAILRRLFAARADTAARNGDGWTVLLEIDHGTRDMVLYAQRHLVAAE